MNIIEYDIIVVGSGLVGSAFAIDLAIRKPEFNIAIIDYKIINPDQEEIMIDRVYAISPNNIKYLKQLNIINEVDPSSLIKSMQIYSHSNNLLAIEHNASYCPYLAQVVSVNHIQNELYKQLLLLNNITIIQDTLINISQHQLGKMLHCKENKYYSSLIIGADGANSLVRRIMNFEVDNIDYYQNAIIANFTCEINPQNTAYQWFIPPGDILAFLPVNDNTISIVLSTSNYKYYSELNDFEFSTSISKLSNNICGKLILLNKPKLFPLSLHLQSKIYNKNIVLIGDAAHTIHPLAGQGVNLGFGDAMLLANHLSNYSQSKLIDEVILMKYNNLRTKKIKQMQIICHLLLRAFAINSNIISKLRDISVNVINKSLFFKKQLIKYMVNY